MTTSYPPNPLIRNPCSPGLGLSRQSRPFGVDPAKNLFHAWITERSTKGLFVHESLAFIYNRNWEHGIGAFMTEGLKDQTTIVKIPKIFTLSQRTVSNEALRTILTENTELDAMCKLAIAYIFESCKGEESPFYGYLSIITLPDVPRLWGETEYHFLKGSGAEMPYEKSYVCIHCTVN
jgi:hypothetical protein